MTKGKFLFVVLLTPFLFACDDSSNDSLPEPNVVIENNPQIDTADIEGQIHLFEYLKRENYGTWISEERLQKLKDSINYDSIMRNKKYPVFN